MKLVYKFALCYLAITLFALAVGGVISYREIKSEIDFEQSLYLKRTIDIVARRLNAGVPPDSLIMSNVEVRLLDPGAPEASFHVGDTLVWHKFLKRMESNVKVSASHKINGRHYYIAAYDNMVESDDITEAVIKSLSGIFLVILVVTGLLSFLISRHLLEPFHKTLQAARAFRLRQKEPLQLPSTRTAEFRKLNIFLDGMMRKARQDYSSLKEFTENASHELQTPLAIIRGKLELLMESRIDDQQARLIMSAHDAVEKLSKTGQSLTLLSKLENREFEIPGTIDMSRLLSESLLAFEELIEMKSLALEQEIEGGVEVAMHPALANILLNNLLGNAIRHNVKNGRIRVRLAGRQLLISNTGEPLQVAPEEMFKRFKKSNQSSDSAGLGLAIVQQICRQSNIGIRYEFREGEHRFLLQF